MAKPYVSPAGRSVMTPLEPPLTKREGNPMIRWHKLAADEDRLVLDVLFEVPSTFIVLLRST